MPEPSEIWSPSCEVVRGAGVASRAERAAVARAGPLTDGRPPHVIRALRALPSGELVRGPDDSIGSKLAVLGRMPLARDGGEPRGQAVSSADPCSSAEWATVPARSLDYRRLPLVIRTFRALPPDAPVGAGDDVLATERAVARWVPLPGQGREPPYETVRHADLETAAKRAAFALGALQNRCLPLVVASLRALPPNFEVAPSGDFERRQLAVPACVPLSRQGGEQMCEGTPWLGLAGRKGRHDRRGSLHLEPESETLIANVTSQECASERTCRERPPRRATASRT